MNQTPPRSWREHSRDQYQSAPPSQRFSSSNHRHSAWSLNKRARSLSPHTRALDAEDPTPPELRLTKKRRGAKLRVAIQALNTAIQVDDNEPGDLVECRLLSYDECVKMVNVIANAKKHAVEYVTIYLDVVCKS